MRSHAQRSARKRWLTALIGLTLVAASAIEGRRWDFQTEEPGQLPRGFEAAVGKWKVVDEANDRVVAQWAKSEKPIYNVVLINEVMAKDIDLSVRVKANAGEIDQGGGLVWRAVDAQNYYVARFNPLESNYRVYKVVEGKRTQLGDAPAPNDRDWHTLRVVMNGSRIACSLDDKLLLEAEDTTFAGAGKIGLWSKADAQSFFDDLSLAAVGE